ncbi:MAG TPA: AI-2E family transporter [Terriglobales bacterium]|nr:AI-2E family transporter [Terriglobales bacterium]
MTILDSRTSRVLLTALLFALGLGFLYAARRTLIVFLFAIFFAYLINPAVGRLEKLVRSRAWAIAIIYLLLVVGLAVLGLLVGPRIARQSSRLGQSLPGLMDKASTGQLSGQIDQLAEKIGNQHGWSDATQRRIRDFLISRRGDLAALAQRIGIRAAEAAQEVWALFLVPILAIFFLRDGGNFHEVLLALVQSRSQREFLQDVFQDLNQMLAQFIRAQLTLAAFSLLAYVSFLGLMRVPYALMLGTAGGALEFVPLAGPLLAGTAMMVVAVLAGYSHWALVLLFLLVWRLIQDYVISPRVMGVSVELHPLAALFGILAGGEIAGMLGVYLSIPVMASLRIVWRRWRIYAEKRKFGPLNEYSFPQELGKGRS